MEYLKVGKIINTYGLQGELKVFSTTDFPELRFKKGKTLYLFKEETNERTPLTVNKARFVGGNIYVISLKGYTHINMVESLLGFELQVEKNNDELPENTYFNCDLEECSVFNDDQLIGKVIKVEDYCGKKSLRIIYNEKEILVPFVDFFIKEVDIKNKTIKINVIEGLL